ncbi:hypothetical protein CLOM_g17560 [Closterium sp. NIES-68]|nr:hypothetical protein CLOM_g17560 [Closterium sp. NIES-68]GJP61181.1 hypothetical protein CLOP_g18372 [Closterium sp. NIES-67]
MACHASPVRVPVPVAARPLSCTAAPWRIPPRRLSPCRAPSPPCAPRRPASVPASPSRCVSFSSRHQEACRRPSSRAATTRQAVIAIGIIRVRPSPPVYSAFESTQKPVYSLPQPHQSPLLAATSVDIFAPRSSRTLTTNTSVPVAVCHGVSSSLVVVPRPLSSARRLVQELEPTANLRAPAAEAASWSRSLPRVHAPGQSRREGRLSSLSAALPRQHQLEPPKLVSGVNSSTRGGGSLLVSEFWADSSLPSFPSLAVRSRPSALQAQSQAEYPRRASALVGASLLKPRPWRQRRCRAVRVRGALGGAPGSESGDCNEGAGESESFRGAGEADQIKSDPTEENCKAKPDPTSQSQESNPSNPSKPSEGAIDPAHVVWLLRIRPAATAAEPSSLSSGYNYGGSAGPFRPRSHASLSSSGSGSRGTGSSGMASGQLGRSSQVELVAHLERIGVLRSGGQSRAAQVMRQVDRGLFVPPAPWVHAYQDSPQTIGFNATISAPHMHAQCLELLGNHLQPGMRALDVGSGTGYLTACLGLLVAPGGKAVGVEHIPELVERSVRDVRRSAAGHLLESGVISLHVGDGRQGWLHDSPYDAIHVGAAAPEIPQALKEQLKVGGRMVIPVGTWSQDLLVVDKLPGGRFRESRVAAVRYVPLTSKDEQLEGY